ncbi:MULTISPECIES: phage tail protein [Pseudomonas]|uniref:Phage tail tube protein, TTP n=1 Tax=Pseudomonas lutea TaxID=243924 RepID=A0A9X8MHY8_9PSED|nr:MULTISPECIES: phage tail protein [Pseudomonas]SER52342.1 Phage tail tube protein, TTP [Pseudomonas lutea]SER52752.1 Phage tail tube protein, TTP [Pseudomonas lutea]
MSVTLINGLTVDFSAAFADEATITALTNANPAVATAANDFADGDVVLLGTGWEYANDRAFRVDDASATGFTLPGLNTVDTMRYPAGAGVGTARQVSEWVRISQITALAFTGGDQNYYQYQFLESKVQKQIPTFKSAMSFTLTILDDPTLPFYQYLEQADQDGLIRVVRFNNSDGSTNIYPVYVGFNNNPVGDINTGRTVTASFALAGEVVRYAR